MSTFEFSAGISIRAYGSITVEADDMEAAIKIINDPDFDMGEHFSPNGGGDDDYSFDFAFPAVNLMAVVVDDDIDTEEEVDRHPRLPNEIVADAAPAMLALLKSVIADWPDWENDEPVNGGHMVDWFGRFYPKDKAAIITAEGSTDD